MEIMDVDMGVEVMEILMEIISKASGNLSDCKKETNEKHETIRNVL